MPAPFCPGTEPLLILVWVCLIGHLLCPFCHEVSILNLAMTSSGRWSIRLQRVQNNAARLVMKKRRRDHVTSLFKELHWLPVKFRCQYKITTLAYRHFEGSLPPYLFTSLCTYEPSRSLRSSNEKLIKIPKRNLNSFGQRSFSFMVPSLWNSLPATLRNVPTLSQFKSHLKTFLFAQAFH